MKLHLRENYNYEDKTFYYGYEGGDSGSYYEGSSFEIYYDEDMGGYTYMCSDLESPETPFNTSEDAYTYILNELQPDDGSKLRISTNAYELNFLSFPEEDEYEEF